MAETTTDFEYPETIAHHFGTWEGKSVHVNPEGKVVDSYDTKIEIGAKGEKYSQRNTYTRPDGRVTVSEFFGTFDHSTGKLRITAKSLTGECIVISDTVFVFNESGQGRDGTRFSGCEVLTLCGDDKKKRMRTMQFLKEGVPHKTSIIVEDRVSKEDVYFEPKET